MLGALTLLALVGLVPGAMLVCALVLFSGCWSTWEV
jgi:hypothetical protein